MIKKTQRLISSLCTVITIILFCLTSCNDSGSPGETADPSDTLDITVTLLNQYDVEKTVFNSNESITFKMIVTNNANSSRTFNFSSSRQFDFNIYDSNDEPVWYWGKDKGYTAVLTDFTLEPGESITFSGTWDQEIGEETPVDAGEYRVKGVITTLDQPYNEDGSCNSSYASPVIDFTLTGDPGGTYDWTNPETWLDPYNWPNDKLMSFAYSDNRTPDDFYQEDYLTSTPYYENTVSTGTDDSSWIELCTNERDQAYEWSEISANNNSYYRDLESELETEKYFEFTRVYEADTNNVLLSRIHKCSYLDRSMYDAFQPAGVSGIFNQQPITSESAGELAEYMWANNMFEDIWSVISSQTTEDDDSFYQTIVYVQMVGGDWGMCDEIYLKEVIIKINKESGEVTYETEDIRKISGKCH